MDRIHLGTSGTSTTRLGYGCSSLMNALGRKESLALLETAYDAGIRHYDVAPSYGFGAAEGCLGEFLAKHKANVTVTTKYGILPATHQSSLSAARHFVKPLLRMFPGVKQRLSKVSGRITKATRLPVFTAAEAEASLHKSLVHLRVDRVDLWLLHEVEAAHLKDDGLLRFLERSEKSGKIGTFGSGSHSSKIGALLEQAPLFCKTLQFEWSILDPPISKMNSFRIHHRALSEPFRRLHTKINANRNLARKWSEEVDADLMDQEVLAAIMMRASLVFNPESITLFSSKNPDHIRNNLLRASDGRIDGTVRRFHRLLEMEQDREAQGEFSRA